METTGSLERRIVTILFADLVGFTSLSERLDPEDVSTVQDGYFSAVRETIARYGGQLEKFIGDAAMAGFGIPRTRDDDAERAVRAGLALVGAVEQLGPRLGLEATDLRLRVGVNTGEVVLAQDAAGAWRVTGDAVNVAARLQAAAAPGGVLLGEATALAVAEVVDVESVGALELKGKAEPVRVWAARGVRPSPSREHAMGALRAPILGRDDELAALASAAARASKGGSERWVVAAPPGVGKSRLLDEFATGVAPGHDMLVLRARLRPDVLAPYQPVAQLFASALGDRWEPSLPDPGARLDQTVNQALRDAGVSGPRASVIAREARLLLLPEREAGEIPGVVGAGEREQRFGAWLELLDALAAGRPAAWLVEDVHWSGGDLLAFLDQAGSQRSPSGRLILTTTRPSLLERSPAWCEPSERSHLLHLPPLTAPAAASLVSALVGDALPQELMRAVAERSDGNPLFIEELLRTWVSVGTLLRSDEGTWRLDSPAEDVPLPTTVQAIYSAQLDDLGPVARQAARRASVAGRRFPRDALEPLGVSDPDPAIDVLSRRALVSGPLPDPLLGRSHQFRHALLRDAGYASLSRAERALLHVRLARWLEAASGQRSAEVAEVIGNHYRAALSSTPSLAEDVGDGLGRDQAADLAATWFERAAGEAVDVAAHDAARALLRQALDLTGNLDLLGQARRWQRLGDVTAYVADMDEGAAAYERAAGLFEQVLRDETGPPDVRQEARSGHAASMTSLGLVRIQQLRFNEAVVLANQALSAIGEDTDLATAWLWYLRAWGTTAFAYRPEVKEDLDRAMAVARTHGDRRLELALSLHLTDVAAQEGKLSLDAVAEADAKAARMAAEIGDWTMACRRLRARAHTLMETDRAGSQEAIEEAASIAEAHGLTEDTGWTDYARVEMGLMYGDWDGAVEAGARVLDLADRNAYHRVQVRTWSALSPIAVARDRLDLLRRAATWFDRHRAIFPGSPFGNVLHGAMDIRLAAAGLIAPPEVDPPDVLPAWEENQSMPSWHAAVETIVESWLGSGRTTAARQVLDRVAGWRDHPITAVMWKGSEDLMRARLLLAEGDAVGAGLAARRGLEAFRRCGSPWWIARTLRLLQAIGEASQDEIGEATRIEGDLGLAGPAR